GVLRKSSTYRDAASISQGSAFAWGIGVSGRIAGPLWASGEVFGEAFATGDKEPGTLALAPVEALAGVSYRRSPISIGIAVGRGLSDGIGTPALRGVMMVSYVAGTRETAPIRS